MIVGAGFAGLRAARELARAPVDVTVVDKQNHHLFQPLLYQVATAALSPADIAVPIRKILRRQRNARVLLGEVTEIDAARRTLRVDGRELSFDQLVVAPGVTHSWFGRDEWAQHAPGLKTVEDATEIRRRFLLAFEHAEATDDPAERAAALTFAVVGAGPTGVELAGAMIEIARDVLPPDFRSIDSRAARVLLLEAGPRVLGAMSEESSAHALKQLQDLGVEVRTNTRVTAVDERGLVAGGERIECHTILWAAGVQASPLAKALGAPLDRSGRVLVQPDLSLPGHPHVFVAGDLASVVDPRSKQPVPGIAPAAIQMGTYVGKLLAREAQARARSQAAPQREPFHYRDKGQLATIGRRRAVADLSIGHWSGFFAWILWALVHVVYLVQFRNRIYVFLGWLWTWAFHERGARLIVEREAPVPEPASSSSEREPAVARSAPR